MSDIATDILEGNIGKKQEKKTPKQPDIATEILEGIVPVQTEIGGKEGPYFLQTEEEPTGKVSTITTKPEIKPVPTDVQRAGFGTLVKAGLVDEPETKLDILSQGMGIPRERFGMVEGRPVYQGDDGILYYVTPSQQKAKGMAAETLARSPSIVMGTIGAGAGPWTAALGAAGGEGIRKSIGSLAYGEPQTISGTLKSMATEAALAYGGEKLLGRGAIRAMDVTKGRKGARLIKAAGRGRERISLEETKRIAGLGKQHGIDLLPPQTTRSPELISRFNLLADLPETADKIGGVRRAQAEQIQTAINKMLNKIAPPTTTAESAGTAGVKAAKASIQAAKKVRADKAAPLYKKAFEEAPDVDIKPVIALIDDELKTAKGEIRNQLLRAKKILEKPDLPRRIETEIAGKVELTAKSQEVLKWIDLGYSKPTAKSMAILDAAIESAEGHPGKGLFPWSVRLTEEAAKKLGLKNRFITTATNLHEIANKWKTISEKIAKDVSEYDTSLQGLHGTKMELDDIIANAKQTGLGNTVKRNYSKIRETLLKQMDATSPNYAKARKIFAGESETFEQLAGKKRLVGRLAKLEGDEVEKAAGLLFKSSPEIINKAKPVITKYGGEDAWNALLRTHLTKSFESIKETVTGGVTNLGGRFRQKVFGDLSQRKIMKAAMSKQQFKNLEDFSEVLDRAGLILGRESTTATRLIQLEEFGGTAAQTAKAIAYPLHTWKMTVYKKVMNLLGGKYNERLADAMLSEKAAKQLETMLQLKPGSQKLLQQLGTFVTLVGGRQYLQELQKKRSPDIPPETIAGKPKLIQQKGP